MSLKLRIVLLTLLPSLLVMAAIVGVGLTMSADLAQSQSSLFRERLLAARQEELRRLLDLARSALAPIVEDPALDDAAAGAAARRLLHTLRFGDTGYFFLYDGQGRNLAHPFAPDLEGQELLGLRDTRGCFVVRELLAVARHGGGRIYEDQDRRHCYVIDELKDQEAQDGGGFLRFRWQNPHTGWIGEKLGLVTMLPARDWLLGTGIYYDDIDRGVALARERVTTNIRDRFSILLGVLGLTTLVAALLVLLSNLHQGRLASRHLQTLVHRYVSLQVEERRQFSRDLHDGINQLMVAAKFRIATARAQAARGQAETCRETLAEALTTLDLAIDEVRRVSHGLRPGLLDTLGLGPAITELLEAFRTRTGIATELTYAWSGPPMGEDVEIILYRVLQEALTNVERHARASRVAVEVQAGGTGVRLAVRDDGRGLDPDRPPSAPGIGLRNMRERAELLSGTWHLQSAPGQGTHIQVELPIADAAARPS